MMKRVVTHCGPFVCKSACRRPATALFFTAASSRAGWLRVSARTYYHHDDNNSSSSSIISSTLLAKRRTAGATTERTLHSDTGKGENTLSPKAAVYDTSAPFNQDDLRDLNAEIGGFVGALGDADFDLEHNAVGKQAEPGEPIAIYSILYLVHCIRMDGNNNHAKTEVSQPWQHGSRAHAILVGLTRASTCIVTDCCWDA